MRGAKRGGWQHTMRWRSLGALLACLMSVCWSLTGRCAPLASSQGAEPWTYPILLSQEALAGPATSTSISDLALAADAWGGARLFWSAELDGGSLVIRDTLFYSYWDGTAWSTPVDVLYMPGSSIWIPRVVADSLGWLHLVWTDNTTGRIWYSRAPVDEAGSVRAWASPIVVQDRLASGVAINADADGAAHLVYCASGEPQGVYHTSSNDGRTWSAPVYVGLVGSPPSEFLECRLGLTIDARGRLHTVWGQSLVQGTPIYYSRSDDGGLTWQPALEVDRKDEKYSAEYSPGRPGILAIGQDEVHIVWFGAPSGQRWHQWSADGGETWSPAEQISPVLRGFMEPPAMTDDSSGALHMASTGWLETDEGPSGIFHTVWRDGRWSPLTLIDGDVQYASLPDRGGGGEFAALAITGGNTLHVAWERGLAEIWVSSLETDAPMVPPRARPLPQASPAVQAESPAAPPKTPATSEVAPATSVAVTGIPSGGTLEKGYSSEQILWISALPAALLVGLVLLIQQIRSRG
jgi:hypothetical protein